MINENTKIIKPKNGVKSNENYGRRKISPKL